MLTISITINSLEYSIHNLIYRHLRIVVFVCAFLHPIDTLERGKTFHVDGRKLSFFTNSEI